jgi:hypothetical protein
MLPLDKFNFAATMDAPAKHVPILSKLTVNKSQLVGSGTITFVESAFLKEFFIEAWSENHQVDGRERDAVFLCLWRSSDDLGEDTQIWAIRRKRSRRGCLACTRLSVCQ